MWWARAHGSSLKPLVAFADPVAMEAYLSKALWRAGTKLGVGLAVVGALVGIRIVTATPTGVEGDIAQLEQLEAELAAGGTENPGDGESGTSASGSDSSGSAAGNLESSPDTGDLDRLVRCLDGGAVQYMRAADCATRGGALEELPPPEPEADVPAPAPAPES